MPGSKLIYVSKSDPGNMIRNVERESVCGPDSRHYKTYVCKLKHIACICTIVFKYCDFATWWRKKNEGYCYTLAENGT